MSFSDAFETSLLNHMFVNSAIANVGDSTGLPAAGTAGSLYVALHTADPGEAGNQATSEISYTGYARVAVARSAAGWTVSGNSVVNFAQVQFGQCTAGSGTATYFSVGLQVSGSTVILMSGALTASLAISNGITPLFAASALSATID